MTGAEVCVIRNDMKSLATPRSSAYKSPSGLVE